MHLTDLDDFTQGYIECALLLADENPGPGEWSPHPPYMLDNIDADDLQRMIHDCLQFRVDWQGALDQAVLTAHQFNRPRYTMKKAGEDFWLTRGGHGSGFWDEGLDDIGEVLTHAAESWGYVPLHGRRWQALSCIRRIS